MIKGYLHALDLVGWHFISDQLPAAGIFLQGYINKFYRTKCIWSMDWLIRSNWSALSKYTFNGSISRSLDWLIIQRRFSGTLTINIAGNFSRTIFPLLIHSQGQGFYWIHRNVPQCFYVRIRRVWMSKDPIFAVEVIKFPRRVLHININHRLRHKWSCRTWWGHMVRGTFSREDTTRTATFAQQHSRLTGTCMKPQISRTFKDDSRTSQTPSRLFYVRLSSLFHLQNSSRPLKSTKNANSMSSIVNGKIWTRFRSWSMNRSIDQIECP